MIKQKNKKMKKQNKIIKAIAIGLFVLAFLLNVSLTFDSGNSQNADLSLGSLKVSLFQKAYASECSGHGYTCNCDEGQRCVVTDWGCACV